MTEITAHGQISKNIFLSGENAKSLALKKHFMMFRLGYLMRIVATWAFFTTHVIVTWVVKWFGHLAGSNPPGGLLPASYPDTLGWVTPGGRTGF